MATLDKLPIDLYPLICEYIVESKYYELRTMHKIIHIFKKNKAFIKELIDRYFIMNMKHLPSNFLKKCNNFKSHNKNEQMIIYENTRPNTRKKLYPIALYNGYIWYSKLNYSYYKFGYDFEKVLDKIEPIKEKLFSMVFTFAELKKRRIHHLDFYDLVEDSPKENLKKYKLKRNISFYKTGLCYENKKMILFALF
jgi:hypothetical protein